MRLTPREQDELLIFTAAEVARRRRSRVPRHLCRSRAGARGRGGLLARLLCPSAPALAMSVNALWAGCRRRLLDLPSLGLRKL
jgi:hypothetical protein